MSTAKEYLDPNRMVMNILNTERREPVAQLNHAYYKRDYRVYIEHCTINVVGIGQITN